MLKFCLKTMLLLTIIFVFPIFIIRAQPFADRVFPALIREDCPLPCFMGMRPGATTIDAALYIFGSHEWSANSSEDFPAQVRYAVMYDAVLPRTIMNWRWSDSIPGWIDDTQPGSIMVEDLEILDITVETYLSVGEIFLAFGTPDQSLYFASNNRRFGYIGWYASQGMLISAEGFCPAHNYYHFPARVSFRHESRGFSEAALTAAVCR
jgi:hypothetical protein